MLRIFFLALLALASPFFTEAMACADNTTVSTHSLPILFLHGLGSNAAIAQRLAQNLSTEARPFVALTACENECSLRPLQEQLALVLAEIRSITQRDARFADGYVLMGHSQGGVLVRGVAAEMDDHKIHTLVTIASPTTGLFYGPQASDHLAARGFVDVLAPIMTNASLFNYASYTDSDLASGKMAIDWIKLHAAHPELQAVGSGYNLYRSPVESAWLAYNPFWPVIDNLGPDDDHTRRKRNVLRLKAAHFFGSPADAAVSPWQSAVLGQYEAVESLEALERQFQNLCVLPMAETPAYKSDTYGLATLDARGALFLHVVENVSHGCWLVDDMPYMGTEECKFQPVFEKTLFPLFGP